MKRTILLILAAAIAVLAAGCGKQAPAAPEPSPAAQEAAAESAAEKSITREVTGIEPDEVIATLDGNTAPAELLTYQIGYTCAYLDYMLSAYGQDALDLAGTLPDGQSTAEYVREESVAMVKQQLVLENLAAQYGIALSAEDEAALAQERDAYRAEYGEDGYREELYMLGLSDAGYERVMRAARLYQALQTAFNTPGTALYASDDDLAAYAAEQGYITADHILISTVDPETREPLDAATVAERREQAEDLLWRLRDSRDPVALFRELADRYSMDPGRATNPDGYTFAEGTMVDAFDAAARALEEGAYSEDLVETEYGYHIILRKPLDTAAAAAAVREEAFDRFFLDAVDAAGMELSPAAAQFDVAAIYDAMNAARGAETADSLQENPFAPK